MTIAYILIGLAFAFTAFVMSDSEIRTLESRWGISRTAAYATILGISLLAWP